MLPRCGGGRDHCRDMNLGLAGGREAGAHGTHVLVEIGDEAHLDARRGRTLEGRPR
jgi:hypothetical protein